MRVTIKISSWGNCWFPMFPIIDHDACHPKGGKFDEANFRQQVSRIPSIQIGSNDDIPVFSFAAGLISAVDDWIRDRNADENKSDKARARSTTGHLKKRMTQGNYSYCRLDITSKNIKFKGETIRGVQVNITTNSNEAMQARFFEKEFAMVLADFCHCYNEMYIEKGEPSLILSDNVKELVKEVTILQKMEDENDIIKANNSKRETCPYNVNTFCSPCQFDCPNYKNGRCVELPLKTR